MNLDVYLFSQINPIKNFISLFVSLDSDSFKGLNNLALKYFWLDTLGIFIAGYLPWILIGILFLFLLKNFKKYWKLLSLAVLSGCFAVIIAEIIYFFWQRSRPFVGNQVNLLLRHPSTNSFPSCHTSFFFALSTIIYFYNRKVGILFFFTSFLIGIARVFSGIHWLSDVLGGMVVGIFSGWLLSKIFSINQT